MAATQTLGESGNKWFQSIADVVRRFRWLFEVCNNSFHDYTIVDLAGILSIRKLNKLQELEFRMPIEHKNIENVLN